MARLTVKAVQAKAEELGYRLVVIEGKKAGKYNLVDDIEDTSKPFNTLQAVANFLPEIDTDFTFETMADDACLAPYIEVLPSAQIDMFCLVYELKCFCWSVHILSETFSDCWHDALTFGERAWLFEVRNHSFSSYLNCSLLFPDWSKSETYDFGLRLGWYIKECFAVQNFHPVTVFHLPEQIPQLDISFYYDTETNSLCGCDWLEPLPVIPGEYFRNYFGYRSDEDKQLNSLLTQSQVAVAEKPLSSDEVIVLKIEGIGLIMKALKLTGLPSTCMRWSNEIFALYVSASTLDDNETSEILMTLIDDDASFWTKVIEILS